MSKMWILLTYKNCSNESENAPDYIDFGLFLKKFLGGGWGGGMPRTPLDCASSMQMRMSRRLCRRSIDSSTRKNFPLFSQQSVTGYADKSCSSFDVSMQLHCVVLADALFLLLFLVLFCCFWVFWEEGKCYCCCLKAQLHK